MKFLNKLERKFGRYAINNLMKYIIALYAVGMLIGTINPTVFLFLNLDFGLVAKGQIWRLVTFLIPYASIRDILFVFIKAYVFYMIGNSLERAWGAFRLNFYFFSSVILNILAALIVYIITRENIIVAGGETCILDLFYTSMFFAFAAVYPNTQFLLYFIIPIKVKYLAIIDGIYYAYIIYSAAANRYYFQIIPIIVSLANFVIFFLATRNYQRISPREFERKARYRRQMNEAKREGNVTQFNGRNVITRHKCAVCGRTELDDDQLEFRFCSKCDGNYEYCMDHLFTHEHVKKQ